MTIIIEKGRITKRPKGMNPWRGIVTHYQSTPMPIENTECPKGMNPWRGIVTDALVHLPNLCKLSPKGMNPWRGIVT